MKLPLSSNELLLARLLDMVPFAEKSGGLLYRQLFGDLPGNPAGSGVLCVDKTLDMILELSTICVKPRLCVEYLLVIPLAEDRQSYADR